MELNHWSEELNSYNLSNEYSIQKAEPEEWGLYCSVYYNMAYTGFLERKITSLFRGITLSGFIKESQKSVG